VEAHIFGRYAEEASRGLEQEDILPGDLKKNIGDHIDMVVKNSASILR